MNAKTVSVTSGYSWAVRVPRDRIVETRKQQPTDDPIPNPEQRSNHDR